MRRSVLMLTTVLALPVSSHGTSFSLLVESDADHTGGSEVFLIIYDSLADFLSNTQSASGFSAINVGSTFGIGGFSGLVPIFADGFESGDTSAWTPLRSKL